MEIEIDPLSSSSIQAAARRIRDYQESLGRREAEMLEKLANEGAEVARERFQAAVSGYDGDDTDVTVTVEPQGEVTEIIATGPKVGFLEFGTGVVHPEYSHSGGGEGMLYPEAPKHGTYGKGYGKRPVWGFYPGGDREEKVVLTTGSDPAEAMTGAAQRIAERAADVAREVFGGD